MRKTDSRETSEKGKVILLTLHWLHGHSVFSFSPTSFLLIRSCSCLCSSGSGTSHCPQAVWGTPSKQPGKLSTRFAFCKLFFVSFWLNKQLEADVLNVSKVNLKGDQRSKSGMCFSTVRKHVRHETRLQIAEMWFRAL